MKNDHRDLFAVPADAIVITTNGFVKNNGEAVMGRGCAQTAKQRWPRLPTLLGRAIKDEGNHVIDLGTWDGQRIVAFPVKHHWIEEADITLIARSVTELVALTDRMGWQNVVMPRPGCGNGRLKWDVVRPLIEPFLDDRFAVVTFVDDPEL